jgi:hypothetical protein
VTHSVLELGFWSFFGVWILELGILRMLRLGGGPVAAFVAGLTSISPRIYRHCCGVAGPGEGWVSPPRNLNLNLNLNLNRS